MSSLNSNTAPGNASPTVKAVVSQYMEFFKTYEGFGQNVCSKLLLEEVSVDPKKEEPRKREAKVVIGLTVDNSTFSFLPSINRDCARRCCSYDKWTGTYPWWMYGVSH